MVVGNVFSPHKSPTLTCHQRLLVLRVALPTFTYDFVISFIFSFFFPEIRLYMGSVLRDPRAGLIAFI